MDGRYEREAEFFMALGHPVRLQILEFLASGSRCACELEPELPLDQSTISRHLLTLKRAGILGATKDGVRVIYKLTDPRILKVIRIVSELIIDSTRERLAALEAGRRS
ncbi:MAG: metalloregulator ArsR/SmtB family transcription factor [Candidatus Acetothermia bacterium]|jgi:ArsR family transcriptional regulator|nr:metalloregulator ArsR/SmtB family transcription factor [Candidatus Acetothermia bacterium]MDH7505473.1 metalloregulator ArsR/SmtB family transcription factor [Candidatus Acetothermia bacterium]